MVGERGTRSKGGGTRVCFVVVVGFWDQDKINMCFVICEEILKLAKIKFSENPPRKKRRKEIKKNTKMLNSREFWKLWKMISEKSEMTSQTYT